MPMPPPFSDRDRAHDRQRVICSGDQWQCKYRRVLAARGHGRRGHRVRDSRFNHFVRREYLALDSVTLITGAKILCGRAFAQNAAVTMDTNTTPTIASPSTTAAAAAISAAAVAASRLFPRSGPLRCSASASQSCSSYVSPWLEKSTLRMSRESIG